MYPYPWVCARVETRICGAGKGYPTGTGAGCAVESRRFTCALAYVRTFSNIGARLFALWVSDNIYVCYPESSEVIGVHLWSPLSLPQTHTYIFIFKCITMSDGL